MPPLADTGVANANAMTRRLRDQKRMVSVLLCSTHVACLKLRRRKRSHRGARCPVSWGAAISTVASRKARSAQATPPGVPQGEADCREAQCGCEGNTADANPPRTRLAELPRLH